MDINIRICGEAGQGVQTIGGLLARTLHRLGLHVFATQSYMSRIRGGMNSYDIRIASHELFSARADADLIVALTAEAGKGQAAALAEGGIMLCDSAKESSGCTVSIDMAAAAAEAGGTSRMANSVAAGAAMALLGYDVEKTAMMIKREFQKKGRDVAEVNAACARQGAVLMGGRIGQVPSPRGGAQKGELANGSEAIALSALVSGVKVVSCYPMTPSTGIFTALAGMADMYGAAVEQAEDEICAINLICGAAYAGVPAMTATSGGGFALMVEGISLAGMLELPVFIVLSQRPAPATGLPTRTGQEDLMFAIHAGHGEFPRAVFAPGGITQAFELTRRALETAHEFQTPVIMLTDQFITDLQKSVPALASAPDHINRRIVKNPGPGYRRYEITPDGISPRAVPGGDAFVVVDSDEHTPDGHLTEDLTVRVAMQDKRMRKMKGVLDAALAPEIYPSPDDNVLLCWGSTHGPCREAVDILRARGERVCMAHFPQVWPLDGAKLRRIFDGRRVTAVEGNSTAQFAAMLKQAGALDAWDSILRYDGLPFTAGEIAARWKP